MGGVSYYDGSLTIASDQHILTFDLPPQNKWRKEQRLVPRQRTKSQVSASFCCHTKQKFYVGAFSYYSNNPLAKNYPTPPEHHLGTSSGKKNHALILAYPHDQSSPSEAFSIPDKTQGIIFTEPSIYLSRSYGRKSPSYLEIHQTPTRVPHKIKLGTDSIDVFEIDPTSLTRSIKLPPMSEGICLYQNHLVVLFESGATKYLKGGRGPIDRLVFYKAHK